jgi:hypothetical protein
MIGTTMMVNKHRVNCLVIEASSDQCSWRSS